MASLPRLLLRTRGMGILHAPLNPAAPLPIPGGGSSSALACLGQVRSVSRQTRPLTDLSDGFTYRHVRIVVGFVTLYVTVIYAHRAWKKPRLESEIEHYDKQIAELRDRD